MKTFSLSLFDSNQVQHFEDVTQCIAADVTGSFGILTGHERMVAVLRYGLLRFSDSSGAWCYVAMPGGVLRFDGNHLSVITSRYFLGDDRNALVKQLEAEMTREDSDISNARATLAQIERTLMKRLSELGKQGALAS